MKWPPLLDPHWISYARSRRVAAMSKVVRHSAGSKRGSDAPMVPRAHPGCDSAPSAGSLSASQRHARSDSDLTTCRNPHRTSSSSGSRPSANAPFAKPSSASRGNLPHGETRRPFRCADDRVIASLRTNIASATPDQRLSARGLPAASSPMGMMSVIEV